jgi:hypothetical protein
MAADSHATSWHHRRRGLHYVEHSDQDALPHEHERLYRSSNSRSSVKISGSPGDALGARKADVLRLVVGQGVTLIALGTGVGAVGAFLAGHGLRAYLFGIGNTDPLTLIGVVLLLGGVALVACWLPARAACRVDPLIALKSD